MKPTDTIRSSKRSFLIHPAGKLTTTEFRKALPALTRILPRLEDVHRIPLRVPITETIRRRVDLDLEVGNAGRFDEAIGLLTQAAADRWAREGRPDWSIKPLPACKRFHCEVTMCMDAWLYACEFAWHVGCDIPSAIAHLAQIEAGRVQ